MSENELEDAIESRVRDIMADNDAMRNEIWAMGVALRVMAERIIELERAAAQNKQ